MLRIVFVFTAVGAITLALLPVQAVAVRLGLPLRRRIPVRFHRMVCALLGIRVREIGRRMHEHPLLIVANHCSWLDIPVITSVAPVVFVAK
jgi:lyso-ornithine lipid O-acyltransferase